MFRSGLVAAVLAAAFLSCAACTRFENPIVAASGPALDDALLGRWSANYERGSAQLDITRDGNEGHLIVTMSEKGQPPQTEQGRLLTAKLERQTFASFWGGTKHAESWTLLRYELNAPDRLNIYMDNDHFWNDAVRNKQISGEIKSGGMFPATTVTASSDELSRVVLGYGSVIFDEEPVAEFTRVPAN